MDFAFLNNKNKEFVYLVLCDRGVGRVGRNSEGCGVSPIRLIVHWETTNNNKMHNNNSQCKNEQYSSKFHVSSYIISSSKECYIFVEFIFFAVGVNLVHIK